MEGSVAACGACCWLLRESLGGASQMRLLVVLVIPGETKNDADLWVHGRGKGYIALTGSLTEGAKVVASCVDSARSC